jgi:putative hydrolase of HD superfamily
MNDIAKYLYEMGQLKRVKRSGWWMTGITDPESVAEHTFRTAILGYLLASLEGADPMKTASICLFHDTPETRTNDLHRLGKRYIEVKESEKTVLGEQLSRLPQPIARDVAGLVEEYEARESLESRVAHDADALECLIQAREYQVQGYAEVQDWIDNCRAALKTDAAQNLAEACLRVEPREWWQGLKKMTYER